MAMSGVTDYTNTYATSRTNGSNGVSGSTQEYLNGLKEKYPDVNITVADFNSEKQSDAYMLGTRSYNKIAVSSSIIEKMASDPAAAAKKSASTAKQLYDAYVEAGFTQEQAFELVKGILTAKKN